MRASYEARRSTTHANRSVSSATDDWFNYTRGRFLWNEKHEMAIRHVTYNMRELAKCAAESVGHAECARVEKLPDGMFNKTFLFTMRDGTQVVGKIPNPNAGRAHYTTASEVATMDFVRNELGTPAPKVLAWSSNAQENSVGAEYIIMEKVPGIELDKVWAKLDIKQQFEIVKAISRYQKDWMSRSFAQYGSLYYTSDITPNSGVSAGCALAKRGEDSEVKNPRFVVGPSTGREFLDDGRITVDFDRGPWDSLKQYKLALGLREIACVQNLAKLPRSPISLYGPSTYHPSRSKKIAALENYMKVVEFLLPTEPSISSACIWHPDLHAENIFIHPERAEVLGIIDWQSAEILPLFDHARQPYFLDYEGPQSTSLDQPALPPNFDAPDPTERAKSQSLYLKMSLSALYRRFTSTINKTLFEAMEFRQTRSFEMMLLAQTLLVDGEALYQSQILDLEKEWPTLPGVQAVGNPPFPLRISPSEADSLHEGVSGTVRAMELMGEFKQLLGERWPEKGIVRPDQYDETKRLLQQAKKDLIGRLAHSETERMAWEESWPFDN